MALPRNLVPLIVAVGAGLCVLIAAGVVVVGFAVASMFPGPVTNVNRYGEVLALFASARPEYVSHFPAQIPASATGVRMYFQEGGLQGSTMFELRTVLPPAEFAAAAAAAQALHDARTNPEDGPVYRHLRLWTESGGATLPASRQSLQLGNGPGLDVWGVTIDPGTNEIAYWAIDD